MSESFNERKFLYSIVIALGGLAISLIIGFIIIYLLEPGTTQELIENLFLAPGVTEYVNPVIVFILAICLYSVAGPGLIIWLFNVDPTLFSDILSSVLLASILTWTIVGLMIGFIIRNPQKSMYQGLLTIIVSLIFTIVMEVILVANAGFLITGPWGIAAVGFGILLTVFFSLIMVVYCTVISTIGAFIAKKIFPTAY
ncbi:MAG: hypothetical protein GF329_07825 [Candidatus Lokiarchaeota archaeon]|nr:hypothetical protein [Candidatus Lokiarchaeota archaeon]